MIIPSLTLKSIALLNLRDYKKFSGQKVFEYRVEFNQNCDQNERFLQAVAAAKQNRQFSEHNLSKPNEHLSFLTFS